MSGLQENSSLRSSCLLCCVGIFSSEEIYIISYTVKIRYRSIKEIEDKLHRKGFSPDIIQETLSYFTKAEILNDVLFTKVWIQSRLRKPFGMIRIHHELKLKGIEEEIIQSEMEKVSDQFQNDEMIEHLTKKMKNRYKTIDPLKRQQRVHGFLYRRGFNSSTIMKVIKQL